AGEFHFEPPSRFTSLDHLVGAAGYLFVSAPAGRRALKTQPLPGSLVTLTSPPISRARFKGQSRAPQTLCSRGTALAQLSKQLGLLVRSHADAFYRSVRRVVRNNLCPR